MSDEIYLTAEGAEKLRAELEELKGPKRNDLARRLRIPIQQGDLSENADYIATKEEQGFLEGRIQEIEAVLKLATIVEEDAISGDTVEIGTHVTVKEGDYPAETYHLVGANEADPQNGKISNESPFGKALIGHGVGDEVTATTPGGEVQLKILEIK